MLNDFFKWQEKEEKRILKEWECSTNHEVTNDRQINRLLKARNKFNVAFLPKNGDFTDPTQYRYIEIND